MESKSYIHTSLECPDSGLLVRCYLLINEIVLCEPAYWDTWADKSINYVLKLLAGPNLYKCHTENLLTPALYVWKVCS